MSSVILAPPVLFFLLGALGALAGVKARFPDQIGTGLALYLLIAIGLKGAAGVTEAGVGTTFFITLGVGVAVAALIPLIAFITLRSVGIAREESGAIAAHYGSISIVTFVAAVALGEKSDIDIPGYMVAVAALMEAPAIIIGLVLASGGALDAARLKATVTEVILNESVFLLLGAFAVGLIATQQGLVTLAPVFIDPFQGVLSLFLLDMGLKAGRALRERPEARRPTRFAFAIGMPLIAALLTAGAAHLLGLPAGDTFLLIVLAASASYIAAPAAVRIGLPDVDPGAPLALSLGITFPFNILVGLQLYLFLATLGGN